MLNKTLHTLVLSACLVCLFLIPRPLLSQKVDVAACMQAYPNYTYIYLKNNANTNIQIIKNALSVVSHHHEEFILLKSGLNSVRSKKIRTSSFITVKNLDANLLVYNGKSHKKTKITSIDLKSENDGDGEFYNDDQYYTVNFLNAKEGDIVSIDYDLEYNEPRFFGIYYFSDYSPTLQTNVSVTYPKNILKLKIKEVKNQDLKITAKTDSSKKTITRSWNCDTIDPLGDEYLDVGYRYKASYVMLGIEKYSTPDSTINLCGSLDNLYTWYNQLLKKVDLSKDETLARLTDSLIKDQTSNEEKLKKIYYWVQNKIAYLAYEDGLGGYVPREAAVVCKRRFGDCKDMANLLVRMSQLAKLPVYHAWIGTRDIPYQFSEFPAPYCANHMIAAYINNKDTIFMDATGKNYPFKLPTSMIQGKEALVGISPDKFIIAKVPFINKNITLENDSVSLTILPNNRIQGQGYYKVTGYEKTRLANYLEKNSYSDQKDYLKAILEKGNNKFKLDTFYTVQNEIEKPLIVYYKFVISDHLTQSGDLTFVNLNFLAGYFDRLTLAKRKYPIDFSYNTINKLSVSVNLSAGYKVDFVPENVKFNNHLMGFEMKYSHTEKEIRFENTVSFNQTTINAGDFKDFDYIISNYKKNKSNLVSLTLKK